MNKKPQKKISWALLLILGGVLLIINSMGPDPQDEITLPLTIDVQTYQSPERAASETLTVSNPKETKAAKNPRTVQFEYTYSPEGNLTEYTEYIEYTEIEKGLLLGKDGLAGAKTWKVSSNGSKALVKSNDYTLDSNGLVIKEIVSSNINSEIQARYQRRADGKESITELYARDKNRELNLVSTLMYYYSDNGNLISTTLTYAGEADSSVATAYISNTNGSPVKITEKDSNGNVISVEHRGYNKDGTIAYSKTYNKDEVLIYQTWYYYDKDGYLEKSVDFELGAGGELAISSITTYTYFDW